MKSVLVPWLIISLILISCNHPSNSKVSKQDSVGLPYHIDLIKNLNNSKSIPISSIENELEYIPLETTAKSLLRKIVQIEFSDSYIFISDFYKLLQFSRDGRFIRQIGGIGRGPGEYIYVMAFCIDNTHNKIYIKDYGNSLVKEFTFTGQFIRSFKIDFDSGNFIRNEINRFVFIIPNGAHAIGGENLLIFTDTIGTRIASLKNYNRRGSGTMSWSFLKQLIFFDKMIRILEPGVDTLKTLKYDQVEPYAIFNLGEIKLDPNILIPMTNNWQDDYRSRVKDKLWIVDVNENDQFLLIRINYGLSDSMKLGVFNKKSLETFFLNENGFKNDIDGGLNFWPKIIYNDSIMVSYVDAVTLLNNFQNSNSEELKKKYGEKYLRLEKITNKLDEMSNPVLLILK